MEFPRGAKPFEKKKIGRTSPSRDGARGVVGGCIANGSCSMDALAFRRDEDIRFSSDHLVRFTEKSKQNL